MSQPTGLRAAHVNQRKAPAMNPETTPPSGAVAGGRLPTEDELREISASLRGLRYGSISIVVQDGVIIQIDRTEKKRLRNRRESSEHSPS